MTALDEARLGLLRDAEKLVDLERLAEIITGMTDIPSPTGEEGELARWAVDTLAEPGIEAEADNGAQEIRSWIAMLAALGPGAMGETLAYAAIPEWLTGMGVPEAHRINAALPGSRLEVFGECGHWPQHEYAARFDRLNLDFLEEAK